MSFIANGLQNGRRLLVYSTRSCITLVMENLALGYPREEMSRTSSSPMSNARAIKRRATYRDYPLSSIAYSYSFVPVRESSADERIIANLQLELTPARDVPSKVCCSYWIGHTSTGHRAVISVCSNHFSNHCFALWAILWLWDLLFCKEYNDTVHKPELVL